MNFWQTFTIAAVPSIAAIATVATALRDLGFRRRVESAKQFLSLFSLAHGRPADGRDGVGVGEQVTTVHLIADFAIKEKLVRGAAREGLQYLAGPSAIAPVPPHLGQVPPLGETVGDAARKALARLDEAAPPTS